MVRLFVAIRLRISNFELRNGIMLNYRFPKLNLGLYKRSLRVLCGIFATSVFILFLKITAEDTEGPQRSQSSDSVVIQRIGSPISEFRRGEGY